MRQPMQRRRLRSASDSSSLTLLAQLEPYLAKNKDTHALFLTHHHLTIINQNKFS